jgi:hypothetical protein
MTIDGWITMLLSIGAVTSLFGWCIYKVLTTPEGVEHVVAPVEVDPGDREP